jgi:glycosyltransferase involved in cell wall biosynthesis
MRLRRVVRLAGQEVQQLRKASKVSGGRDAVVARARFLLGLGSLESRVEGLQAGVQEGIGRLRSEMEPAVGDLRSSLEDLLQGAQAGNEARIGAEAAIQAAIQAGLDRLDRRFDDLHQQVAQFSLATQVAPVTAWIRHVTLSSEPLISVVLATRDRATLLAGAIESVQAQEYTNWELIVVDDESTDGTAELLRHLSSEDHGIVVVSQNRLGVGGARNAGLSAARGEFVCYLDDDNRMQPLWLKAVVWAAECQPGLEVLYGARIMDVERVPGEEIWGLPFLQVEPFNRRRLEKENFIDLGVLAHRRDLPEASFDERLEALGDWDLILRLTAERTPRVLPVVALHYTTTAPHRITRSGRFAVSERQIRERLARDRPLRILAYNSLFPLLPETYIADEMRALTDNGAVLAWYTEKWSASPVRVAERVYMDLQQALSEFRPDVLAIHWATFAQARLEMLTQVGVPFAVRVHSFDFDPEVVAQVRDHPMCIGVWAYPHHARRVEEVRPLVPLLTERDAFSDRSVERTIVLSASAGLPKKDWPILVGAFAELARNGADCRIVVGLTHLHEDEPQLIRQLITEAEAPIMLSVDVPHDQVVALLARTAVVVYTKRPGGELGMPRSIIEGMYAGASVIMPDRPESVLTGGPDCRTYRRPEDIVRHVTEILAAGPAVEAERRANRQFAERHFADPALAASFADEFRKAWTIWQAR